MIDEVTITINSFTNLRFITKRDFWTNAENIQLENQTSITKHTLIQDEYYITILYLTLNRI